MGCGCLNKKKVEIISNIKEDKNNNNQQHDSISLNDNNNENNNENNNNNNENNNNIQNNVNNNNLSEDNSISENNQNNQIRENNNRNQIENNLINSRENIILEINNINPSYEPYLQSKHDENFNYKEIEDKYVGQGVKKMKGYISPVSFEELEKIRKDFWSSRIEGNPIIWEVLHTICNDKTLSIEDIDIYMKSSNIVTYKGCINVTYDNKGYLYEIPNYCINDPLEYEELSEEKKIPDEKDINIKIRCYSDEKKIKIDNYKKIKELKDIIKEKNIFNNKYDLNNIRLFFGGKELLDKKEIWYYNIDDDSIIQMLANIVQKKIKIEEKDNINLKSSNVLSEILLNSEKENNNKENEIDESDNFQETLTEQNKLLIKINK